MLTAIDEKYQGRVLIARIPPACLQRYFERNNRGATAPDYLEVQQTELINDLEEINHFIQDINNSRDQQRVDLDLCVLKNTIKSTKRRGKRVNKKRVSIIIPDLFTDGVHPTLELANRWFTRLAKVLHNWASKTQPQESSSSQESEVETADFRRRYRATKRRRV